MSGFLDRVRKIISVPMKPSTAPARRLAGWLLHGPKLGALCLAAGSAQADTAEDFRVWGNMTMIANLRVLDPQLSRWRWWMEGQGRFRDSGQEPDQAIVRTGLGYTLSDQANAWLGYGYIPGFPQTGETLDEHRLWQQFTWSESMSWGDFTSRSRLEQRFIERVGEVGWRFREFIRFAHPLGRDWPLNLVVWDEVFLHLNSVSPALRSGFDQNRAFAGLGYPIDQQLRVELGYLNQFILIEPQNRVNHILSLSLFLNF